MMKAAHCQIVLFQTNQIYSKWLFKYIFKYFRQDHESMKRYASNEQNKDDKLIRNTNDSLSNTVDFF